MSASEVLLLLGTFSVLILAFGFVSDYIQEKKKPGVGAPGNDERN